MHHVKHPYRVGYCNGKMSKGYDTFDTAKQHAEKREDADGIYFYIPDTDAWLMVYKMHVGWIKEYGYGGE